VTPWLIACLALLPTMAVPAIVGCRGSISNRLVACQMLTSVATTILVLLSFALDQSTFVDIPLALALLAYPGAALLALFYERWI